MPFYTSYSLVFDWHHWSKISLTVAARALSTGSVNLNNGGPPGDLGVEGLFGELRILNGRII